MRLTLHEAGRTIKNGIIGAGDIYVYSIEGLPAGENAKIARFDEAWRILRWNAAWHGNWKGNFVSPEAALAALHEEIFTSVA